MPSEILLPLLPSKLGTLCPPDELKNKLNHPLNVRTKESCKTLLGEAMILTTDLPEMLAPSYMQPPGVHKQV